MAKPEPPTEVDPTLRDPTVGPARGISEEEWEATRLPDPIEKLSVALQSATTVASLRTALIDFVESEKNLKFPKLIKARVVKKEEI